MKPLSKIFLFILLLLLIGCGSSTPDKLNVEEPIILGFDENQKSYLYNLFKTEYLWSDTVADDVNYSQYTTAQEMIDALKDTKDRWSFAQTLDDYVNMQQQQSLDFGCMYASYTIKNIRIGSPCDLIGLQRGDVMIKVNGEEANSQNYSQAQANEGVESTLTIERNGTQLEVNITPMTYTYKVVKTKIITKDDESKIGYMSYDAFTSASQSEIDNAFTYFKANGIDELVLDLRYNGGGSLTLASILLDKIAGQHHENDVQFYSKWNEAYQSKNGYYYFEEDNNSIEIKRVFCLTTEATASASEVVINALKPYVDVKLIGEKTHGKPTGMQGKQKDNMVYWLINFSLYNANDEGDFYTGLEVDCQANDNLNFERDNVHEDMLATALHYSQYGVCE